MLETTPNLKYHGICLTPRVFLYSFSQTLHDYLLRNMDLFRLESTFEIRADIVESVKRMPARLDADGNTQFDGYVCIARFFSHVSYGGKSPAPIRWMSVYCTSFLAFTS